MGTVYCTKENHVFETDLYTEANGIKYAIDATVITEVKAYPLRKLATMGEGFAFICKFHPRYGNCDEGGWLDDLDCLIGNECDEDRLMRATLDWGSDPAYWEQEREKLYKELLAEAIKNFKTQF